MKLPELQGTSTMTLEDALAKRRSIRSYKEGPLTLSELGCLLWAAQGRTGTRDFRAAPSAGATYPLELYVAAGNVRGLEPGLYRYVAPTHELSLVKSGDLRAELSAAALDQPPVREAAVDLILTAVYERTTDRYGERGKMYVHMDVGHAAENLLLQATALGLGAVPVGAFRTRTTGALLGLAETEVPLYIIPVGRV